MASQLPTVPWFVFTILEPISLLGGFLAPILDAPWFIISQMSFAYSKSPTHNAILTNVVAHDATAKLLAQQLGNTYLLLGLLGVFVLSTTSELKVVRAYLWALWLGDIGHVGLSLYAYGLEGMRDYASWSPTAWGNTLFTVFLFAVRSLYFAGAFSSRSNSPLVESATKDRAELKRSKRA